MVKSITSNSQREPGGPWLASRLKKGIRHTGVGLGVMAHGRDISNKFVTWKVTHGQRVLLMDDS